MIEKNEKKDRQRVRNCRNKEIKNEKEKKENFNEEEDNQLPRARI